MEFNINKLNKEEIVAKRSSIVDKIAILANDNDIATDEMLLGVIDYYIASMNQSKDADHLEAIRTSDQVVAIREKIVGFLTDDYMADLPMIVDLMILIDLLSSLLYSVLYEQ